MDTGIEIKNGVKLEKKKIRLMLLKIIYMEKNNVKTKEYNDSQMISRIQKVIEEEAKCL